MLRYIVRETVTLIREVEAEDEAAALAKVRTMSVADFDYVDCSEPERITVKLDTVQDE